MFFPRGDEFIKILALPFWPHIHPFRNIWIYISDQGRDDRPFLHSAKRDSTLFAHNLMEHEMLRASTMDIVHVSDFKRDYV